MIKPSFLTVKHKMMNKGFVFFSKPYSVNIVGIRNNESDNKFTCTMCLLYYTAKGEPIIEYFPCTTKPGRHWLLNPLNSKGAAILKDNQQVRGMFKIGTHNKSRPSKAYEALEQIKEADYVRDNDKNSTHNYTAKSYKGNFKTNIHRAASSGWSSFVNKWSAGCQVITGIYKTESFTNWQKFMKICKLSAKRYGNSFTYTLMNENDFT